MKNGDVGTGKFGNRSVEYPKFVPRVFRPLSRTPGGPNDQDEECKEEYEQYDGETLDKLGNLLMSGCDKYGALIYFCELLRIDVGTRFNLTAGMLTCIIERYLYWDFHKEGKAGDKDAFEEYKKLKEKRNYVIHNDDGKECKKKWSYNEKKWEEYKEEMIKIIKWDEQRWKEAFVWNKVRDNGFDPFRRKAHKKNAQKNGANDNNDRSNYHNNDYRSNYHNNDYRSNYRNNDYRRSTCVNNNDSRSTYYYH